MSNKSGTSSQVISLPKGGGALSGIGETFSPDLFTGTGNFTVPVALPPGRNGFQPELNLVYSTGNGNGPFGLGWSLSVPGVSRKTSQGIPIYDDTKDTFILSGAEDLVPIEESGMETRYRPRTEGLFARVIHHHDAENDYWEVRSKDGLVSLYGSPGTAGNDPAVVADPVDRMKVFAWKLTQTTDPFGNTIKYEYLRDAGEEGAHHWDQLYLSRIDYVDYTDGEKDEFLVAVVFEHEDRPDPFSEYRAGFEIRTRKRYERIETWSRADEDRLVRSYDLVYLDQRHDLEDLEQRLPINGVSLLSQIKVTGHDGDATEALPPLEFGYTRFAPEGRDFFPLEGRDLPARSLASPDLELADLLGNGLPDLLEMNGTVRYWRNLGEGKFDLPRPMRDAPAGLTLADPDVQLMDADGDGRIDLLATNNGLSGYYPLQYIGEWDRRSFQRYEHTPSFSLADPEVKLVDLNGDGVTDVIRSGTRLECFFNDPKKGGWNATRFVERRALDAFPNINFSDPRVKWADISGDGLQDIVLVYDGNVEYWPNLGYGNWGKRLHMRNSPRFPYGYDPRRILIGDVDGDGLADIVYVDDTKVTLWINQSGNQWSDSIEILGTPPVSDMDAVRLVDLLGSGISGVLWSADVGALLRESMYFLDFTGGVKPYVLNEMNNHMGAVTRVQYESSIRFYLEDRQRPETRWQTPLPFPVQVVARVEVIDEISGGKLTTEYRYHHGYWDGAEREFRGFGMVEQLDTETFETYNAPGMHGSSAKFSGVDAVHFSPPTLTKTWFHQGPIGEEHGDWYEADYSREFWPGDPPLLERPASIADFLNGLPRHDKRDALRALRGSVLRTELYALDGAEPQNRPYTVTESLYGLREEAPPGPNEGDRLCIFFPHPLARRTTQWERGDDPMTQFTFTEDYDTYGQPQRQTQIACPRGWRGLEDIPDQPYLATRTETTYVRPLDPRIYIVDRTARTTTWEITNSGGQRLLDLKDAPGGSAALEIIGQSLNFYDGAAFQGLPFAAVGPYGALVRTETLVLTSGILRDAYRSGDRLLNPPEAPPYLDVGGPPAWTADYPQEFRNRMPILAGYTYHPGVANSPYAAGYFTAAERRSYDFQENPAGPRRGLPVVARDPLGNDARVLYDAYELSPVRVTDQVGLSTMADYDYRVFQPRAVTDPNGNRQTFGFTPLGLPARIAVMGREGENVGDTPQTPGVRFEYDFMAFADSPPEARQPVFVRTVRREHHVFDIGAPLPERDETITTVEYSDGFGRLLQTRTQGEDVRFGDAVFGGDILPTDQNDAAGARAGIAGRRPTANDPAHVVVSGWQTYDNKGRVVEKYEPFFSTGWDYAQPGEAERGQRAIIYYDPRGQVVRTVNPDGSERRVIYGAPVDLSDPDRFTPTPWEAYTYDENDNAGRTHPVDAQGYRHHWNTPAGIVIDALGRAIEMVERNREAPSPQGGPLPPIEPYRTRFQYDIRGNPIEVFDPLGRRAFHYVYDLANRTLRTDSIDAGIRRMVIDAAGNEIERRDSKGALIVQAYDVLQRPVRIWARDSAAESITLRERIEYGDGGDPNQNPNERDINRTANRLGKPYRHYDEAGLLTFEAYDFKSNVLEKTRRVIGDAQILNTFAGGAANNWQVDAFRVDWQPPIGISFVYHADSQLDGVVYRTSITYDALNRMQMMRYPQDVTGDRRELRPRYNRAGALEQVELDGVDYIEHIAYNAKGQRTLVTYGNGVMTRYAYDPLTFRITRLRTERYSQPAPLTYHPTGAPLQNFAYGYDLAGNLTTIQDRTPHSGTPNTLLGTEALDRTFTYDPLYRLLSATGRECDIPPGRPPWDDRPRCMDVNRTRGCTEQYQYDRAGNLTQLQHTADSGSFTRTLNIVPDSNRLASVTIGNGFNQQFAYTFDDNGNLVRENTERHFEWDHSDRLKVFRNQVDRVEPSVHAHYLYDAGGQRVKKLVRRQGDSYEMTVYIDSLFEHHRRAQSNNQQENNTLHILDDTQRIATVRVGAPFPDDNTPAVKYHLGDHLGSSNIIIDDAGAWVNREEYTPYGETSFGSFARKRYRFTGKERDEESGLYYYGARYYAPWLVRWVSPDPAGMVDGPNLYLYASDDPLRFTDRTGNQAIPNDENSSGYYLDQLSGVADVHSVAPSGREVYDPSSRSAQRYKTEGMGTRATGAGQGTSIDIEVPLLGHLAHSLPSPQSKSRTGKNIKIEDDPLRKVKGLSWPKRRSIAQPLTDEITRKFNQIAEELTQEFEKEINRGGIFNNTTGEGRAEIAIPYLNALKGYAETLNALVHPITYASKIRHPALVDPDIDFLLHPPPELPIERGKPNPNNLSYEGSGYTRGFEAAVSAWDDMVKNASGSNNFSEREIRWIMQRIGWYVLEDQLKALIRQKRFEWTGTSARVSIGFPGVRTQAN